MWRRVHRQALRRGKCLPQHRVRRAHTAMRPCAPARPPQCGCCTNRTVEAQRVCTRHSAPLLGLLWGCGGGGGHLETLKLTDCHLAAAAVAPPPGAAQAQALALEPLAFLQLNSCFMEQGESFAGFLAALLPQLPGLHSLELRQCELGDDSEGGLGDALALAGHLTWLVLHECGLEALPPGAHRYLAGRRGCRGCPGRRGARIAAGRPKLTSCCRPAAAAQAWRGCRCAATAWPACRPSWPPRRACSSWI